MKRNYEIRVKVTKEEHDILQTKAKQLAIPISVFLRVIGLKANLVTS